MSWRTRFRVEDHGHDTPCWIWTGAPSGNGYGRIRQKGRNLHPHRALYEETRGPVPSGLELDHLCRVTLCINPDHLEAVTHGENARRRPSTKLTKAQVAQIRSERSRRTLAELAREFGVHNSTISRICSGEMWAVSEREARASAAGGGA